MKRLKLWMLLTGTLLLALNTYAQQQTFGFKIRHYGDQNPDYMVDGITSVDFIRTVAMQNVTSWTLTYKNTSTIIYSNEKTTTNTGADTMQTGTFTIDTSASPKLVLAETLTFTPYNGPNGPTPPWDAPDQIIDIRTAVKGTWLAFDELDYLFNAMISIPKPVLSETGVAKNHCLSDSVSLQSFMWGNQGSLTYSWYVNTSNSNTGGTFLTSTSVNSISFLPSQFAAVQAAASTLTANGNLYFYCIASGPADVSPSSPALPVAFAAPPPTVGSVTSSDVCPTSLGSMVITGVSGSGSSFSFIVRPGLGNDQPCDPTANGCTVDTSGTFNGSSVTVPDIQAGQYTLLVANGGGGTGACYRAYDVTVNNVTPLAIGSGASVNISCPGGSDGTITLTTTGGKISALSFSLSKAGVTVATQGTGVFTGLTAGTYTVSASDGGCSAPVGQVFTLTQPTTVTVSYTKTDATCLSSGNGSMLVTAAQGSGNYTYSLYRSGSLVAQQVNTTSTTWTASGLLGGVYDLQVSDAATSGCAIYEASVAIGMPSALGLSLDGQTNLSCNGVSTGAVSFSGSGGFGGYNYNLSNGANVLTNTSGSFSGLAAGSYTAMVASTVSGCGDQYVYPQAVVVTEPPVISIGLRETDVTCNGLGDGQVSAVVSGGTGALGLNWEVGVSGSWSGYGPGGAGLTGLQPGVYRLTVTDANGCSVVSSATTVAEPAVLAIASIATSDIVCYGGSGTIDPQVTGGNGGYGLYYSTDGSGFLAFSSGAGFSAGSYTVKVIDSKGCQAVYPTAQVITSPASALTLSDQLSDYNGYNISCYGATTGVATLTASGGNGASYSGYSYAVDGGAYGASAVLSGLSAGSHVFYVQDGRGCVVQQGETLTQPVSELSIGLADQTNNDCANGSSGMLQAAVSGGTFPYSYSIDGGGSFQASPQFVSLPSGSYSIIVKDMNGCQQSGSYSVVSLNPPIVIDPSVRAVTCNGGEDGAIALSVSGGYGGYTYQWNVAGDGSSLNGLSAGTYRVVVTDDKACIMNDTMVLSQPVALSASLAVKPVCSDATVGAVRVSVSGGTPPYQYSSDGGSTEQGDSLFASLSAGSHNIWVSDSHGCSWTQVADVPVNPLVPKVSFLVSTLQNALDTLEVEDISQPKPDSVQWVFDPATLWLGADDGNPLIRFAAAGTYPVTMTAFYGGCDFSLSQNILINPYDTNSVSAAVLSGQSFDSVLVAPNPNNGVFNLYVKLFKAQRLVMVVTNLSGQLVYQKEWSSQLVSEQISLPSGTVSGTYFVELVTESDVRDYTLIVTK